MIDLLRAYKKYDPAAKSLFGVLFLYPGVKALFFHRLAHVFYKLKLYFMARLISELGRLLTLIEIHPGAEIGKRLVIDHGAGVVIGETSIIGDDCVLFQGVTLGGLSREPVKRHPTLGHKVMIGAGAKILGNIHLGHGTRVGANAVVTGDVPENATVVGVPGKIL